MINVSEKVYQEIAAQVGPEKMRQIERNCGIPDATPQEDLKGVVQPNAIVVKTGSKNEIQNQSSNIVGAEHIAKSERDGIPIHKISMSGFELDNLGKSFIFTEEEVVEEYKRQIIQLHGEINEYMKISAEKAIKIGELLLEQKKRIRRGGFTKWVEVTMPFTVRTAQNYMKLFCYKEELQSQGVTSLCDAYALVNGKATPNEVDTVSDYTDTSGWSIIRATVDLDKIELPKKLPKGRMERFRIDKELVDRMNNEEFPFEGLKGQYLKIVVDISYSKKIMTPELLGNFLYIAGDYLKPGGKLIMHKGM